MAHTLIIGYGNRLRGDDGLGWYVAHRLAAVLPQHKAQVEACHQLTPELAEPISRADLVIFIDAEDRAPAGQLSCRHLTPGAVRPGTFSHYLTPPMLLACVQGWYGTCPEAVVLSVSSQSFDCGEELSPSVASVVPELLERICASVRRSRRRSASAYWRRFLTFWASYSGRSGGSSRRSRRIAKRFGRLPTSRPTSWGW